ncbi:hypothetical protein AMTR_s00147p00067470 [Amborella trichopoda]|uniref:Uncharacterized protein n=1 Tax=Amborella trichopoda TaxID=13333 RepID=W1P3D0_AMBTC|nr:hypothetical protein AMTR_s00147p00067470 [Amborella trichopoda]
MSCDVSYLHNVSSPKIAPKSPLSSPRALFTTLSNKTLPLLTKKKGNEEIGDQIHHETETETETETEEGLWQRKILMGEKCEPPDFSGVIYYDHMGNQLSQFPPKSPRREFSPTFSFPVLAQEGTVK